ncbi:MAG TPA: hypothetical protein VGH28_23495 [Polyangiaceae bacterium]|jgi:hypothetical protein
MRNYESGPGFYIVGFTLGHDGGAVAVLERAKTERKTEAPKPLVRGTFIPQRTLEDADRDAWHTPYFSLRHVATFAAGCFPSEAIGRVRELVTKAPLEGETTLMVDVTDLGQSLREHCYEFGRENYYTPVTLTREPTTSQSDVTPIGDVRGAIVALHASKRLRVADKIPHKNEVARIVEHAARGDELPRLALAIGLACLHAKRSYVRGPWPGRQRPKPGTNEFHELEAHLMFRRELEAMREDAEDARWWSR